jgi:DnaJ-class molecular chaperone
MSTWVKCSACAGTGCNKILNTKCGYCQGGQVPGPDVSQEAVLPKAKAKAKEERLIPDEFFERKDRR